MLEKNRSLVRWAALAAGAVLLAIILLWNPTEKPSVEIPPGAANQITELKRAITAGPYNESQRYRLGHLMLQYSPPNKIIAFFSAGLDSALAPPERARARMSFTLGRSAEPVGGIF